MNSLGFAIRRLSASVARLIREYPVRAQALVQAGIGTATAFGLGWTAQQVGAVMVLSAATLAFFTERAVTPLQNPSLPSGTSLTVTTPGPTPDTTVKV